jgi:hypothetical protein
MFAESLLSNGCLCWLHSSCLKQIRKFFHVHHIQVLCRLYKGDHAYLTYLMLQWHLCHWNGLSLTTAKFKPLIFTVSGVNLSYAVKMFIHLILYDICQICYIIVYIRKVESCVQIADLCCTSENFQWCREPCFASAVILRGRCLPLGQCKSY